MISTVRTWLALGKVKNREKIIIVAHPDDETFWAGATLAHDSWFSVCLTHRSTPWRRKAYKKALRILDSRGVILDLPDKHWNELTDNELTEMNETISLLLSGTELRAVMTHSPDGETGHPFHKLISAIVSDRVPEDVELWYFSFDDASHLPDMNPAIWSRKRKAIDNYMSATPGSPGNDVLHAHLGEYEAPIRAKDYIRPTRLIRSVYAGSTVPNAGIQD